jgi:hypothetical protein
MPGTAEGTERWATPGEWLKVPEGPRTPLSPLKPCWAGAAGAVVRSAAARSEAGRKKRFI